MTKPKKEKSNGSNGHSNGNGTAKENGSNGSSKITSKQSHSSPNSFYSWWRIGLIFVMACVISVLHTRHLSTLFENDRHFSHLADFEREMAYRTEMGLYFSYYKTLIQAKTFSKGLNEIVRDNITEHGHEINTLKRFNLYPEVILGFAFRHFRDLSKKYNWRMETCWQVNRGAGVQPIQSCEGFGNSHYFYVDSVFALAGTVAASIFVLGVLLSDSILGGLLAVSLFFFNHGECTRVQWTPPLRESFSFPIIMAQIMVVTMILKTSSPSKAWLLPMASLTTASMLCWQFAQFAFFTQVGSLFVVHAFDYISLEKTKLLVAGHLIGFASAFTLLFGNEMLLTTFYFPSIIGLLLIVVLSQYTSRISLRIPYILLSLIIFVGSTLSLKFLISRTLKVEDDAHILDILRSKFSDFATFHTRLYTCSAEFDFLKRDTIDKLTESGLYPTAALAFVLFVLTFVKFEWRNILWRKEAPSEENAEIFYNVVQGFCYTVMALMIMRLKLLMNPHLCILAAVVANGKVIRGIFSSRLNKSIHIPILMALFAYLAYHGKAALDKQWSIHGEYSNPEQEELFNWIHASTPKNAVFAGTMPVMANVKLSTHRPIVNHPHYEDVGIRERTMKVYSIFSKKPIKEVHRTLKSMGVNYVIFQLFNCAPDQNRPYCAYRGMWDEADTRNIGRISNCDLWHSAAMARSNDPIKPFSIVFNPRNNYIVLKV